MLLLTWHGTILRVEQSQNRLLHAKLVPVRDVARDFSFTVPENEAGPVPLPGGMHLHSGPAPDAGHIAQGERILRVVPDQAWPSFNEGVPTEEDSILAVSESEVAALRALLSAAHILPGADAPISPRLEAGFVLAAGPLRFDLRVSRPNLVDDVIVLPGDAGRVTQVLPTVIDDIPLQAAPPPHAVPNFEAFRSAAAASLVIEGAPDHHFLPLTAAYSNQDWFYKAASSPPRVGIFKARNVVRRAREVFVLDAPGMRTILTRDGALHGAPAKTARPPHAQGVSREGDHFFLAAATLDAAPRLAGPHALLPAGGARPLLEPILPLVMMAPLLSEQTRLLLPADERADWPSWLALFGFGQMEFAEAAGDVSRVEDLIWADECGPEQLSAATVSEARARAHATLGTAGAGRRLFLTTGLANADRLANVASAFAYERHDALPDDPMSRAALFATANSVIAAHGPALENILFCPAGAQVVELTPDHVWRPTYSALSDSLGHIHAVLPCPVDEEGSGLAAEAQGLRRLLRVMAARR
jgi:hypothetical protein